jgi:choline monooxygenase
VQISSSDSYHTEVHDMSSLQTVTGAAKDDRVGGGKSLFAYLFPNFMLNRYGPWLDTNAVIPTGKILIIPFI